MFSIRSMPWNYYSFSQNYRNYKEINIHTKFVLHMYWLLHRKIVQAIFFSSEKDLLIVLCVFSPFSCFFRFLVTPLTSSVSIDASKTERTTDNFFFLLVLFQWEETHLSQHRFLERATADGDREHGSQQAHERDGLSQ